MATLSPWPVNDWIIPAIWPAPARVHALTTTRRDPGQSRGPSVTFNLGMHGADPIEAVANNRVRLCQQLALPAKPHWLHQVHGRTVVRFPQPCGAVPPQADAAVTDVPGTVLAVLTADCLPVLFCANDGSEVGIAHAGWRGLAMGVLEATIAAMRTPTEGLLAWLGPAIGAACYEVGVEVRDAFVETDVGAAVAFKPTRPGHWYCDLYTLARLRLAACGVSRIEGGGLCTYTDASRFYSFRRDGSTGRMASLIWIERH